MGEIYTKINKLYNEKTYLARYGLDVWFTIIICLIFFVVTSYYYVMNNIQPIVADWDNQKCSPIVIPFAGLINNSSGTTPMEFTEQNFTGCIQTILGNITGYAFAPVYYVMNVIMAAFQEMIEAVDAVRAEFDTLRDSVSGFSEQIMSKILNIVTPLIQLIIAAKAITAVSYTHLRAHET